MLSHVTDLEKEQFEVLKDIVLRNQDILKINYDEKLKLSLNLTNENLNQIEKIMNSFEERLKNEGTFSWVELEIAFNDIGISYQKLKHVIKYLFEEGVYVEVISCFLKEMNKSNKGVPLEYKLILEKI